MNVVVFGPGMELRPIPQFALRPVPDENLTDLESAVRRIFPDVTILGIPWVNPHGVGKAKSDVVAFLESPSQLFRALVVAFNPGGQLAADRALIASSNSSVPALQEAQQWVKGRMKGQPIADRVVWIVVTEDLEQAIRSALS